MTQHLIQQTVTEVFAVAPYYSPFQITSLWLDYLTHPSPQVDNR